MYKPELAYRLGWFNGENAGGTWTLDIRDDGANASGGTLTGWSIEICEEPPLPSCGAGTVQTTVFSSDFESGAAGFTHSGTADEWALGLPATAATSTSNPVAGLNTCNSGTNCWKTDLTGTYNVSSSQDLLSPNINLTGLSGPITLSWAQWYQMENTSFDHANVVVREAGNPSNSLKVWEFLDATMTDAPGNPTVNVPASAGWGVYRANISSFAGKTVEVVFHLDSDSTINFSGLAIDDVTVTACQACPAITCPTSITTSTDLNQCSAVVNYTTPISTGCSVTCTPASGSTFVKGTTTVSCSNGGASTCTFTVTVNDTQPPPIMTCPANITTNTAAGQCSATVTYTTPTPTDNCPGVTASCTPASGTSFAKGTTTVTCTATDTSTNATSCTFTVTVNDNQNPTVACPANISLNTAAGLCTAVATYTATATDNCPGVTVACSPASGSTFAKGVTTVTCTATDASTNTAACTFTVTVVDNQAPTVTCPANISGVPAGVVNYTTPTAN
ncbi:MAG: HYR domain-containing protein, partial [Blastocatellia bacterium]